jgi:ACS family tartrate transporter-like MFS transporter
MSETITTTPLLASSCLDSACRKAYWRLLPLLFACYVIAYVDRANVSIAKLTMSKDMPAFNDNVIGKGAGIFFLGYFLLEVPGTLLVERWSARKWISRIMVTWGIIAAMTALVKTPTQFYIVRFALGLAEAGFFPGVIVFLTHWFPLKDRSRALAWFLIATPVAQIISPKISGLLLKIGTPEYPAILGMQGWQWVYILWGIPAVILGVIVFLSMPDHPREAKWLTQEEKDTLGQRLADEQARSSPRHRMTLVEALRHPKVLLLALAYAFVVTGNYGIEFFMPSIFKQWHNLKIDAVTWLVLLPPLLAVAGQLFVGWNSDRTKERRLHAAIPALLGAIALAAAPFTRQHLWLTVLCFAVVAAGLKAYLPAFWSLPNLFLTQTAAAGSIGLINSIGNLGGFVGPFLLGKSSVDTGSFVSGIYVLAIAMFLYAVIIMFLGLGKRST